MADVSHDEHYVRAITSLGDAQPVITSQAIYTKNRIKLVEKGVRVTSELYDRLVRHKLAPQIDECLAIANEVSAASLADRARLLIETRPELEAIRGSESESARLLRVLATIPLAPPIAFKLTVAREQLPDLFFHSLVTAAIAADIGIRSGLLESELRGVTTAAMLHDIGKLHIDPALMEEERVLTDEEWRHIYSHPVTAYLILNEYPEYRPDIANAVLEHHERVDGSGFPRGLKGEEISFAGQMVSIAEAAATLLTRTPKDGAGERLAVHLKLSHHKFDRRLIDRLSPLWHPSGNRAGGVSVREEDVSAGLLRVARAVRYWGKLYSEVVAQAPEAARSPLVELLNERINRLERVVSEAGFDPADHRALLCNVEGDGAALAELRLLAREFEWQLDDILREARRRQEALAAEDNRDHRWVEDWMGKASGTAPD